jgi:hypothetical protein
MANQLVPYWDAVKKQFQGPANVPSASVEVLKGALGPTRGQFNAGQVGNLTAATIPLGIASRPGVVKRASLSVTAAAVGGATGTVDIKKNGTTILTGTISIDNTLAARTELAGTLSGTPTVQPGDVLEAVVTANVGGGTLPTGLAVSVAVDFLPVSTDVIPLGVAPRAGKMISASVTPLAAPTGNDTYSIDIQRNGVTILSAPVAVNSSSVAKTPIAATLTAGALAAAVAANDYFEAVITYTHGTGGPAALGFAAQVTLLQN